MSLFGYTSCTRSKEVAARFARDELGKKGVIFEIIWSKFMATNNCYLMDETVSAYPDE
jgi:hypothetical protein